jgi:hypothetical protein
MSLFRASVLFSLKQGPQGKGIVSCISETLHSLCTLATITEQKYDFISFGLQNLVYPIFKTILHLPVLFLSNKMDFHKGFRWCQPMWWTAIGKYLHYNDFSVLNQKVGNGCLLVDIAA